MKVAVEPPPYVTALAMAVAGVPLVAVTVSVPVSPPPAVRPVIVTVCAPASQRAVSGAGWSTVGASLTAVTVRVTVAAALLAVPSVATYVKLSLPLKSAVGV